MKTLEHGHARLDVKSVAEDGTFQGYASLFGVTDLGKDVVNKGAFTKSLASKPASRVRMLREHDQSEPIGVWTSIKEDATGLAVSGQLVLDTVKGRETHALLKAGALDGLSIGYRTKSSRLDKAKGIRMLDEVELHEISVVTFPMLPAATVHAVKHNGSSFRALVDAINSARDSLKD
ncbi:HK97 family phage prohead protease [Bradyrhizobium manausense]|uniref:Primosomal replication protein N n=1 Tax=Bradyrhizobium manausense TaxID=989370 RepID=A0A0R3D465_9BRAD|nr:HK97 family phage prohead protease [Bradyrhizobium manausense]KRQ03086.1 primosomal replication protein N [Bradyrhizobium manausense]